MKRFLTVLLAALLLCSVLSAALAADLYGLAIDNLATRSGPGTQYTGCGSYKIKGQQVTALYEIIPADAPQTVKKAAIPGGKPLKYAAAASKNSGEILTFRMWYLKPQGKDAATEKEFALTSVPAPKANWQWAAGVAEFGLFLRNSEIAPRANAGNAFKRLQANLGGDPDGSRTELLLIVKRAMELKK